MASWRLKSKVNAIFKISDKEKYFKTHEAKIDFLILTSKSQGHFEARMWPPRDLFLKILDKKTCILTSMKQNRNFEIMTSHRPFAGQYVAFERYFSKINVIFKMFYPRNLKLDTHKPKYDIY